MKTQSPPGISPIDRLGRDAALLSAFEIGLGSLLHGLRIPLGGHFLSLNQGFWLTRGARALQGQPQARTAPFTTSAIAALLKSLSPAGKKLTPMLAISTQGALFSIGTLLLGPGLAGTLVGVTGLALWGFVQPIFLALLLFGKPLVDAVKHFYSQLAPVLPVNPDTVAETLLVAALGVVALKVVLAWVTVALAFLLPQSRVQTYRDLLLRAGRRRRNTLSEAPLDADLSRHLRLAARDLLHPLFLFSLALTALFFVAADSPFSTVAWGILRPVAIGFLIFFVVRAYPVERLADRLARSGFEGFGRSLGIAIRTVKEL